MTVAVVDTTVLSNLARLRRTEMVRLAFPQIQAPEAVRGELLEGQRLGHLPKLDWSWLPIRSLTAVQLLEADRLGRHLDRGEAECLVLAGEAQALLLTDDRAARREAAKLDIYVSGTLGVLTRLYTSCGIPLEEAESCLRQMVAEGYRSPVKSLAELFG